MLDEIATDESIVVEAGPYPNLIGLYDTPKGRTTVPLRVDGTRTR